MKKNLVLPTICSFFTCLLFINGTGRDDVPLSKYINFAKDSTFNCIGELYFKNEFEGSCVLINKKYIITSAHNFEINYKDSMVADSQFDQTLQKWHYGGRSTAQRVGNIDFFYLKLSGKKYYLKNIYIHDVYKNAKPYRDSFGIHSSAEFNYDIAIAELKLEVPDIQPAIINEDADELNKRAIIAGYGQVLKSNDYTKFLPLHWRRKFAGENIIDSVGGFRVAGNWAELYYDFDAPNSDCCNRMGSPTPLPLEYYIGAGDCGGGMFIYKDGKWKLAGVCAADLIHSEIALYGNKYGKFYGFTANYIRVYAFKDWIKEQMSQKKY